MSRKQDFGVWFAFEIFRQTRQPHTRLDYNRSTAGETRQGKGTFLI